MVRTSLRSISQLRTESRANSSFYDMYLISTVSSIVQALDVFWIFLSIVMLWLTSIYITVSSLQARQLKLDAKARDTERVPEAAGTPPLLTPD